MTDFDLLQKWCMKKLQTHTQYNPRTRKCDRGKGKKKQFFHFLLLVNKQTEEKVPESLDPTNKKFVV